MQSSYFYLHMYFARPEQEAGHPGAHLYPGATDGTERLE